MLDTSSLLLAAGAGVVGGAMNALAGGGTFATMPALIALGLPGSIANATSNVALQPGAIASAWAYRKGLGPLGGLPIRLLAAITFVSGLVGSLLLVWTPSDLFDVIVPWLLLVAFLAIALGKRAAVWLHDRVTIGPATLVVAQVLLGVYGGYFGGGVGMMVTATYGLLAGTDPKSMAAPRTLMLATANSAAAIVFILCGMVAWAACVPMLLGGIIGGWLGAKLGVKLTSRQVRAWTLLVTFSVTVAFFVRAYG